MILFLTAIALSILVGYLLGGQLRGFERLRLRWWGLAPLGLALQFVPLPEGEGGNELVIRTLVLGASYLMLLVFTGVNINLPGVPVVMIGLALNCVVIVANGGMPVSGQALQRSGQADVVKPLFEEGGQKHHLLDSDDDLTMLADVIPIGSPFNQVVSLGDVFVYAGVGWLIVATMRGRTLPAARPEEPERYRGRHRRGKAPVRATTATPERDGGPAAPGDPALLPEPPPPAAGATTSGTGP